MNGGRFGIVVFFGLALIIIGLSVFTVNERELALGAAALAYLASVLADE